MSTVATNLVATMIQNNFSGNVNSVPNQSMGKKGFQDYFTQSKDSFLSRDAGTSQVESGRKKTIETRHTDKQRVTGTHSKNNQHDQRNSAVSQAKQNSDKENVTQKNESDDKSKLEENRPLETDDVRDVAEVTEELLQEYAQATKELLQKYAKALGISVEQLQQALQNMDLNVQDLLDPQVAQKIVMAVNQLETSVDLITNEQAMQQLRALNQVIKDVPEDIKASIHSLGVEDMNQPDAEHQGENVQSTKGDETVVRQTIDAQKQSSGDGMMQEGQANKAMSSKSQNPAGQENEMHRMNFENALNQVVTQKTETIVMNNTVQTIVSNVSAKDVFDQIVDGMKVAVTDNKTSMTLQLQPENLGKIALNLTSEHGVLTGHFVAESEVVKEAIEANLAQLKTQLQQQGLNINEIKITVGDSQAFFAGKEQQESQQQSMFKKQSKSSFRVSHVNGDIEEDDTESLSERMNDTSSSVEFSA